MAAAIMSPVVSPDVGGQQPLHPLAHVAITMRPKNEMEMCRHQAVSQDTHGKVLASLFHQGLEVFVVPPGRKNPCLAVATV